jgi:MYXO-CTERM domain-containing protein
MRPAQPRRSPTLGLCALLLMPAAALASQTGITGYSGKTIGTNCRMCHTLGTNANPSAAILGAGSNLNVLGTINVTVSITQGSTQTVAAGINVALAGTASVDSTLIAGPGTQIMAGELTHTGPKPLDAGTVDFTFGIRAGNTNGPLTIYISTIGANRDMTNGNDGFYAFNRTIQVTGDSGMNLPPDSGVIIDPDSGVVITPTTDAGTGGTGKPPPPTGGFVGGDYGCSSSGGSAGAWLVGLGLLVMLVQRRSTKST